MKDKKSDFTACWFYDLLNDESQDSIENLLDYLKQIGLKYKSA